MFRNAVLAALEGCGREAIDIGINPTPTAGVVVRRLGAAGAVQITASHNPADQNGVKLLDEQGKMLPPELGRAGPATLLPAGGNLRHAVRQIGAV